MFAARSVADRAHTVGPHHHGSRSAPSALFYSVHAPPSGCPPAAVIETGVSDRIWPGYRYAWPDADTRCATKRRRHGRAMRRAQRLARLTRALSVAMPVFAYIWR